jgi:transglutaminase-like putative cysteine protease
VVKIRYTIPLIIEGAFMRSLKGLLSLICLAGLAIPMVYAISPMPKWLNREEMLASARTITREAAPDARTLNFANSRYVEYAVDGSSIQWIELWVKAFTEEGAKELLTIPLWYKKGFMEGEFQLVEVVRPDGTIVPVDLKANVKDVSSNDGNDVNIYDQNSRQLVLTLPKVEKGDVVHVVMAQSTLRPRVPNAYMDFDTFESSDCPLPYSELTIVAPKELRLKSMALLDEVPGTMQVTQGQLADGRMEYRWVARDVPQMFPEENMPEEVTQVQRVVVSTFSSWEELSKWYWDLCAPHLAVTPGIVAKVKELTEGKSREEQIAALFGFVAQEIRYMGIIAEDTAPGYEPHDVALTFDNRYGVCRDKGALLVAMLREAGFNAFPVLINSGSKRDKEVALPFFNHAIIAIDEGDFQYRLMDPTDDTARAVLPAYLSDCTYMVARPEGDTLRLTPVPNPADHLMLAETEAVLDKAGNLDLSTTLHFNGVNDNIYRSVFVKATPEQLRERMDGMVKRVLPGAELTDMSFSPADPKDITQPLVLKLQARMNDYAVPNGEGHTLVKLPYFSRAFGLVNFVFEGLDQPTRKYDWEIYSPSAVRETLTMRGFNRLGEAQLLPQDPVLKVNGASYDVTCSRNVAADTITLTRELEMSNKTYSPEDYLSMRRFVESMSRFEDLRPLFVQNVAQNEDATVLKDVTETTLNDDGSVIRRYVRNVRVNTFQGKRAQGEVKLWHSPDWQTLELEVAEVTKANGDCIAVGPTEINVLDDEGSAVAPRYGERKQTVISLPAVDVGSVSHVSWVLTSKDMRPFCEVKTFDCQYSTKEETYTLAVPLSEVEQIRIAERNFEDVAVERSETVKNNHKVYSWTLRNRAAVKAEPGMPSKEFISPTIYVAHRNAAAHRMIPRVLEQIETLLDAEYPTVEATVKTLVKGIHKKDVNARLKVIQEYLARSVRVAGPSWAALPFGQLTDPETTLTSGYGNRLDRMILWLAMLREARIEAEVVFADSYSLAYNYAFMEQIAAREVPRWTRFTTPYLRLKDGRLVGDGKECDELTASSLSTCALMTAKGRELFTAVPEMRTHSDEVVRIVVDARGDAVLAADTRHYGLEAGALRRMEREFTPETRRRAIAAAANAMATGAVPCSEYIMDTKAYPVRTRLAVSAKNYGVRQGALLSIPMPGMVAPIYNLRGTRRANPIWQSEVENQSTEVDIWLPKGGVVVSRPEPFKVTLPGGGSYELALKEERIAATGALRLTYTVNYTASPAVLDSWFFPACVELNRRFAAPEMQTIIVRLPE